MNALSLLTPGCLWSTWLRLLVLLEEITAIGIPVTPGDLYGAALICHRLRTSSFSVGSWHLKTSVPADGPAGCARHRGRPRGLRSLVPPACQGRRCPTAS